MDDVMSQTEGWGLSARHHGAPVRLALWYMSARRSRTCMQCICARDVSGVQNLRHRVGERRQRRTRTKGSESLRGSVTTDGLLDNKKELMWDVCACVTTAQVRTIWCFTCCMPFTFHGLYSLRQIHEALLTMTNTRTRMVLLLYIVYSVFVDTPTYSHIKTNAVLVSPDHSAPALRSTHLSPHPLPASPLCGITP